MCFDSVIHKFRPGGPEEEAHAREHCLKLFDWLRPLRPYECADALRRLDDYLDRRLTPRERRLVEAHLATCTECVKKFRFETSFVSQVRSKLHRIDVPPHLAEQIHARLRQLPG